MGKRILMSKILLVGGGGREDAVARKIVEGGSELYAAMKNRNPSIVSLSSKHLICNELDYESIVKFAVSSGVELAFIGPDPVLETPLAGELNKAGILVASPSREAARIETSKAYMRDLLIRHNVHGNIFSRLFTDMEELREFFSGNDGEYAVKPIGLTGGKGVKVMGEQLRTRAEALEYASELISKDGRVLLEERLKGEEFSLQVFTDGTRIAPTPLAQDFKRAYENDEGPNTGGMGSITDRDGLLPFVSRNSYLTAVSIMQEIVDAMRKDGDEFRGVMYGQFMDTETGPRVVEVNARFADPESLNVLSLFKGDFTKLLFSIAEGHLITDFEFEKKATVLKYIVPKGYGTKPQPGILKVDAGKMGNDVKLYYAAVSGTLEQVEMSSSRSLALVGMADSIEKASEIVEENLKHITGDYFVRHDIGSREMMERKSKGIRKA